ncbi:MAG: BlaI/MecI/CopY family transcriptional regulator [Gemmatimonadaceae bacterium]
MGVIFNGRELDVMAVLWSEGPSTVAEVRDRLDASLAYNTVLSFLRVLEEKGHVAHVVEGKAYRYRALVNRADASESLISRLLDTVFGGSPELLLTQLVRDRRVGAAEIHLLRQVLEEKARECERNEGVRDARRLRQRNGNAK